MQNAGMPVNITIRDVPDEVRNTLATRARRQRKSMQEYLREQLEKLAEKPSIEEWVDDVRAQVKRSGTRVGRDEIVEIIREMRGPIGEGEEK
jgi:plasmid stability protein